MKKSIVRAALVAAVMGIAAAPAGAALFGVSEGRARQIANEEIVRRFGPQVAASTTTPTWTVVAPAPTPKPTITIAPPPVAISTAVAPYPNLINTYKLIPTNMTFMNGFWASNANWDTAPNHVADLECQLPPASYGQTTFVSFDRKVTYQWVKGNLKWFRIWPDGSYGYPNLYVGSYGEGPDRLLFVEDLPWNGGDTDTHYNLKGYQAPTANVWRHEEYALTMPSGLGKNDGRLTIRIDGVVVFSTDHLKINDGGRPSLPSRVCIQEVVENDYRPNGSVFFRDVFISRSNP